MPTDAFTNLTFLRHYSIIYHLTWKRVEEHRKPFRNYSYIDNLVFIFQLPTIPRSLFQLFVVTVVSLSAKATLRQVIVIDVFIGAKITNIFVKDTYIRLFL